MGKREGGGVLYFDRDWIWFDPFPTHRLLHFISWTSVCHLAITALFSLRSPCLFWFCFSFSLFCLFSLFFLFHSLTLVLWWIWFDNLPSICYKLGHSWLLPVLHPGTLHPALRRFGTLFVAIGIQARAREKDGKSEHFVHLDIPCPSYFVRKTHKK